MTYELMERIATSMLNQNGGRSWLRKGLRFNTVWTVGNHIWYARHCAEEWVEQVETPHPIVAVSYREAYEFAQRHKTLKLTLRPF